MPPSASTQWEIRETVEENASTLMPAYVELMRQGAQADVIYQDDTTARVLSLNRNRKTDGKTSGRKGTFTTGLVCESEGKTIACFFTGNNHAGENLRTFLKERSSTDHPPLVIHPIFSQIQKNSPNQHFFSSVHACRKDTKHSRRECKTEVRDV